MHKYRPTASRPLRNGIQLVLVSSLTDTKDILWVLSEINHRTEQLHGVAPASEANRNRGVLPTYAAKREHNSYQMFQ